MATCTPFVFHGFMMLYGSLSSRVSIFLKHPSLSRSLICAWSLRFMVTFHGGMRALTYEWGSRNHLVGKKSTEAPDDTAFQEALSSNMASFLVAGGTSHPGRCGQDLDA